MLATIREKTSEDDNDALFSSCFIRSQRIVRVMLAGACEHLSDNDYQGSMDEVKVTFIIDESLQDRPSDACKIARRVIRDGVSRHRGHFSFRSLNNTHGGSSNARLLNQSRVSQNRERTQIARYAILLYARELSCCIVGNERVTRTRRRS